MRGGGEAEGEVERSARGVVDGLGGRSQRVVFPCLPYCPATQRAEVEAAARVQAAEGDVRRMEGEVAGWQKVGGGRERGRGEGVLHAFGSFLSLISLWRVSIPSFLYSNLNGCNALLEWSGEAPSRLLSESPRL